MKRSLATLALLGIQLSLLGQDPSSLSEEQRTFYEMLTPDAKQKFLQLDEEHRKSALQVIPQSGCGGAHECAGIREKAVEEQYQNQQQQRDQANSGLNAKKNS